MIEKEMTYFLDKFLLGSAKHRVKMKYVPLKIVFFLASPISLTHPWMHFDGLVGHLLMVDALGDDYFVLPRKFPFSRLLRHAEIPPFPIKCTRGIYHASISFFDTERKALEILYKKFEDRWAGGRKRVSKGMGFFRDYSIQHIYIPTQTVTFYVCGDVEILKKICSRVTGLGDNTRIGWGAVRKFEIEKLDQDQSLVYNNIAMRPIPDSVLVKSSEKVSIAWKPPYWAPESIGLCAPPGARVKLKWEATNS